MTETESTQNPETAEGPDFRMFIQKLAMQGFYALGLIDIPGAPKNDPNPDMARMVCDDLMLLRDKTEGNLDEGERLTLDKFISDLQFQIINCPASESEHECCGGHDHESTDAKADEEEAGESGCCGSCQ